MCVSYVSCLPCDTHVCVLTLPRVSSLQCCSLLQCVAVCCSVLQCVAVYCSVLQYVALQCVAVCCSMLQRVAACCSVWQCVAASCSVLQYVAVCCSVLHHRMHSITTHHSACNHPVILLFHSPFEKFTNRDLSEMCICSTRTHA